MSGSLVTDAAMARPAARLAPLVRSYVGYRFEGFAPGTHLGLPSRHLTVVLSLGAPIRVVEMPGEGQRPAAFQALLGGLHTRPAQIAHDGDQYGVQLELTPLGARSLLGLPAGALGPAVVDLGEFLGPTATELCDRMASAPDWTARFALLDRVLGRRAVHHDGTPAEVARAWHIIVGGGGTARVGEVATEVGWSRRHLGERFAREYGLTPKAAARVVRFGPLASAARARGSAVLRRRRGHVRLRGPVAPRPRVERAGGVPAVGVARRGGAPLRPRHGERARCRLTP